MSVEAHGDTNILIDAREPVRGRHRLARCGYG